MRKTPPSQIRKGDYLHPPLRYINLFARSALELLSRLLVGYPTRKGEPPCHFC